MITENYGVHDVTVFTNHHQAEAAVKALCDGGYDMKNLSIIGQEYHTEEKPVGFINVGNRMWAWGTYGAFWGTIWGLLFGSALIFLPGVGPVMMAGYIVGALEGALVGGGLGVLGAALASAGVPANSVIKYEAEIRAGSFLLIARGTESQIKHAHQLIEGMVVAHAL